MLKIHKKVLLSNETNLSNICLICHLLVFDFHFANILSIILRNTICLNYTNFVHILAHLRYFLNSATKVLLLVFLTSSLDKIIKHGLAAQ